MKKITFCCDNNANIHSKKTRTFSEKDLGLEDGEWDRLHEKDKEEILRDWAMENFSYWIEKEEDE